MVNITTCLRTILSLTIPAIVSTILTPVMSWRWRCSTLALLWPLHTAVDAAPPGFQWLGHPLDWVESYLSWSSSHSCVKRRRFHWRVACPNALILVQRSLFRTQNDLSTSFRRTVYITTCMRTTVLRGLTIPAQSPPYAFNLRWPVCLPASTISLHCSLYFGFN